MSKLKIDLAIIGAGPGGYTAAIKAAELGKKVVIIDKESVGGVCLQHGCIPTKALIRAAQTFHNISASEELGIKAKGTIDFKKTQAWKKSVVKKLDMGVRFLLKHHKIILIKAIASFLSSTNLKLEKVDQDIEFEEIEFKKCIIAAGSRNRNIPCAKIDGKTIITSTQAIELEKIPKSILVIGGGYIGIELSQMFSKLGTKVIIVEALPDIMNQMDSEFSTLVRKKLENTNAEIYTDSKVIEVSIDKGKAKTIVETSVGKKTFTTDHVLVSIGRIPNSDKLNLESTKVKLDDHGFIKVDKKMLTTDTNIYAIGDIIGGMMLAHKAAFEGKIAAQNIAGKKSEFNHVIPYAMFSDPEISGIGLTEKKAKENKIKYNSKLFKSGLLGKYQIMGAKDSIIKVIYNSKKEILGMQMAGPHSADIIGGVALAMQNGITLDEISETIHPHPTIVEGIAELADLAIGFPINTI
ncbi:dihydrolipoyl dehydrogenase [archaeon]|jgi:dihydrolipoamide dehydrogenase|nr:dihydrolipoyl dehydrogenase [archaeon]MBT4023024.1 dihydrolipoyl dehydrogenase [archaeon]MBT4272015.1 dihydrolipoyl dehydrogenase [archaeon]MBT4461853.1 dihydrolipoyl dehydrogenase [archaeon]MBT4857920.1 dihydrolipoyl dehydrogenase [archaeon]